MNCLKWLLVCLIGYGNVCLAQSGGFPVLFEEGRDAVRAGDFARAAELFEAAVELQPANADALLLLGTVYGHQQKFDQALEVLERAKDISPEYADVRIAIARIHSWQEHYDKALSELAPVLDADPSRRDALELRARVLRFKGDADAAAQAYEAVLAVAPNDPAALLALGDLAADRSDIRGARSYYRRATEAGATGVEGRLAALDAGSGVFLDLSYTYSGLKDSFLKPWQQAILQLRYKPDRRTAYIARLDIEDRAFLTDVNLRAGIDRQFSESLGGYASFGATVARNFRETWSFDSGLRWRARKGSEELGTTVLALDYRHSSYDIGGVNLFKPSVQQYFADGRFWLTLQAINILDQENDLLFGGLVRGDMQTSDRLRIFGGLAHAPETETEPATGVSTTVDTKSLFLGFAYRLPSGVQFNLAYAFDDRDDSYKRHAITAAIGAKF